MRIPLKLTSLIFTFLVICAGMVYAFKFRDTTIVIVGMGIVGGVVGANVACDIGDRKQPSGLLQKADQKRGQSVREHE